MSRPQALAHPQNYARLVSLRFARSRLGLAGLACLILLAIIVLFGRFLAPHDPDTRFAPFQPPSHWTSAGFVNPVDSGKVDPVTLQPILTTAGAQPVRLGLFVRGHLVAPRDPGGELHLLGTDRFGRDIFSRGLVAARISLGLATIVVTLTTTTGLLLGAIAGYRGGAIDRWLSRLIDFVLAFPQLPLYLALGALIPITLGSGLFLMMLIGIMAMLGWAGLAREIRGKTMVLARMDYVRAAIALGATDWRVVYRHIAPNLVSHVLVSFTLTLPAIVLLESFLGFLGLAVKPPLISWGLMLQDAGSFAAIGSYPWILSPVGFVFITVFAFNAVGDALRDAIDPY